MDSVCNLRTPDFSVWSAGGGSTFSEVKSQVVATNSCRKKGSLCGSIPDEAPHPLMKIVC